MMAELREVESVRALGRLVHQDQDWGRGGKRFMAMLWAYMDESGTDSLGRVSAVAGYIATEDDWVKFSRQWAALLQEYSVSEFHMMFLDKLKGEFSGWDRDRKEAFL